MKNLILFLIIINLGCFNIEEKTFHFKSIECNPDEMPKYDYRGKVKAEMTPQLDSMLRIEKRRVVFKPCREMIYKAEFKSETDELISSSRIKMMASGKRWEYQPEMQEEILIQYEFTQKDFKLNQEHQLNKGMLSDKWTGETREGVIENVEEIWMHPFRSNQFNFTEVAPFPKIKLPLKIGKSWTGRLRIQGWGDWANTRIYSEYEVVDNEKIETEFGQIENCWKIKSKSTFKLGESTFDYWFNEELGFVKMNYKNYGNQILQIELVEIIAK